MNKFKTFLVNIGVLAVSGVLGILLCELAARLILNPADYLNIGMIRDPIYGAIPAPTARSGFDSLGFRNREVPTTADIVAIGDSQTYGNAATMEDSWPYALGRMLGRHVYNMGLGGYGPNQYLEILKTKALGLKPRMVLLGLSVTDDFDNAYHLTYGLEYWAYLRKLPGVTVDFDRWDTDVDPHLGWGKGARVWLSRHSVVYQLAFHTGWGDRLKGKIQVANAPQLFPGMATTLIVPDRHIEEAFQPVANLHGLNQDSQSVQEGMRITFELLREMDEICRQNHIEFVVVVIPTKEMVFERYLQHNPRIALSDVVDKLLHDERTALNSTFQFLRNSNIAFVDPLPAMQAAVGPDLFAHSAGDMHPNKNGYRLIAGAIADGLKQQEAAKRP